MDGGRKCCSDVEETGFCEAALHCTIFAWFICFYLCAGLFASETRVIRFCIRNRGNKMLGFMA